jgi:hypothetical protein
METPEFKAPGNPDASELRVDMRGRRINTCVPKKAETKQRIDPEIGTVLYVGPRAAGRSMMKPKKYQVTHADGCVVVEVWSLDDHYTKYRFHDKQSLKKMIVFGAVSPDAQGDFKRMYAMANHLDKGTCCIEWVLFHLLIACNSHNLSGRSTGLANTYVSAKRVLRASRWDDGARARARALVISAGRLGRRLPYELWEHIVEFTDASLKYHVLLQQFELSPGKMTDLLKECAWVLGAAAA